MNDLRRRLHAAAARPAGPFDADDVRRRVRYRHRRRVASVTAGVIAVLLAGVGGVVSILDQWQGSEDVEVELAPAPSPEPRGTEAPLEREEPPRPSEVEDPGGAWSGLPPAPIEGRAGAEAVWTGEEVIVWGGVDAAGAAYDPAAEEWRELPEAPLPPRENHVAVWTGEELLVWGGTEVRPPASTEEADASPVEVWDDGAAYDPSSDEWRPLPEAPIDGRSKAAAVWTGEELLITGGSAAGVDPGTFVDRRDGAAYDPGENSWRTIADLPEDSAGATDGVWTGDELVVPFGTHLHPSAAAAYDPGTDTWRALAEPPVGALPGSGTALAWTGDEVAVVFGSFADDEEPGRAAAYDPENEGWRELPAPSVPLGAEPQAVWAGESLVVVSSIDDPEAEHGLVVARLEAGADDWVTEEGAIGSRGRSAVTWTGEELFVWGGVSGTDEEAKYHDDGATWRPPPAHP